MQDAIAVYISNELNIDEADGSDGNVIVKDWLKEGKSHLDVTREALLFLCEPVAPPKEIENYLQYFCGISSKNAQALDEMEPLRIAFYKAFATFARA